MQSGQPAEAIRIVRVMFESAPGPLRWPMYVRNVKQYIRSIDATFDERRYGFTGILDLLRGCQREGVFRLERDRKGVLRVFPATWVPRAGAPAPTEQVVSVPDIDSAVIGETATAQAVIVPPVAEPAPIVSVDAAQTPREPEALVAAEVAESAAPQEADKPKRRRRSSAEPKKTTARARAAASAPRGKKRS